MGNIEDPFIELREEIKRDAYTFGQSQQESFFGIFALIAAGNGDCLDLEYEPVKKAGATGYQVDGYALDTEQGDLYLAISDFRTDDDLQTLNQTQIDSLYGRVERFYKAALSPEFINTIEETSPAFQVAYPVYTKNSLFNRVRVIIFSNAKLVSRRKSVESKVIFGKKFVYNILDFTRYVDINRSFGQPEPIEIDFETEFNAELPCLKAHIGSGDYASYLIVMPGELLARVYELYGAKLLEQNVRTFLQAKTKVNQGIITTLEKSPQMFFAYNNGLTATASGVQTRDPVPGMTVISSIKNLQIVNGGQTTASILYAKDNKKADLKNVFVQMKLTVLSEDRVEEIVPKISRFANSQNKISDADFFSTHPFHVEMEQMSRRISAPQKEGAFTTTKWFYERARGQYKNKLAFGKALDSRKFEAVFPVDQLVDKTDLAKYVLSFECLPHQVSQGAQKCFMHFADKIGKDWESCPENFNEGYFKDSIAKAIVFRWTDQMIARSAWYREDRGYKAQIVTYSIAWLVNQLRKSSDMRVDLQQIWTKQAPTDGLKSALERISPVIAAKIKDAPSNVKNIGEYCKQQACWAAISSLQIDLPSSLEMALIDKENLKEKHKDDVTIKKIDNDIQLEKKLFQLMSSIPDIISFATSRNLLSPAANTALEKISTGNINVGMTEKKALSVLFQRMADIGYEFNV
jgi:hypothetical protein